MKSVTISGRKFELTQRDVESAVAGIAPEPLYDHYVVVGGRRYPPKQVISCVTSLDRADFTTHQARRILMRLGFTAARREPPRPAPDAQRRGPHHGRQADALRPYLGQWVALSGDEVLVGAATASDIVAWLSEHGRTADSVFRVSGTEQAASGAAPA